MNHKPRVAWILCSNRWNSAITEYALSSARALRLLGWEVHYSALAGSPGEQRARQYELPGEPFASFGPLDIFKLRRIARRLKPTVVLLFGGPETFLARLLPGMRRIRFRGQDKDLHGPLPALAQRLSMSHCQGLLLPALALEERFADFSNKSTRTIPLGVDEEKFHFHPGLLAGTGRPTLTMVGRLDPIKGHHFLFAMFQHVLERWPDKRPRPFLEVIGQAANISEAQLRLMAQQHQLTEGADWCLRAERVADIGEAMSRTHLGMICSLGSEVICRVAEEFLLCGTPIMVSGAGALEEALVDKSFGASYLGLDEDEAAHLLADQLWLAFQEDDNQRQSRAQLAKSLYSLRRMGVLLQQYIEDLGREN